MYIKSASQVFSFRKNQNIQVRVECKTKKKLQHLSFDSKKYFSLLISSTYSVCSTSRNPEKVNYQQEHNSNPKTSIKI